MAGHESFLNVHHCKIEMSWHDTMIISSLMTQNASAVIDKYAFQTLNYADMCQSQPTPPTYSTRPHSYNNTH